MASDVSHSIVVELLKLLNFFIASVTVWGICVGQFPTTEGWWIHSSYHLHEAVIPTISPRGIKSFKLIKLNHLLPCSITLIYIRNRLSGPNTDLWGPPLTYINEAFPHK